MTPENVTQSLLTCQYLFLQQHLGIPQYQLDACPVTLSGDSIVEPATKAGRQMKRR
jgi:hypothetical protein